MVAKTRSSPERVNPFKTGTRFCDHYFNALTVEKQQIYKLIARHRVPRYKLVDLLFLKNHENTVTIRKTFVESGLRSEWLPETRFYKSE